MDTTKITIDNIGEIHLKRYHFPPNMLPSGKDRDALVDQLKNLENVNFVHVQNDETLDIFAKDRDTWPKTEKEVNEVLKKF